MGRVDPWKVLRGRPWLTLWWDLLPPGMMARWDDNNITLDVDLSRVERRCALMHELVHEERRVGWPDASAATMEREEAIVEAETARRLVPCTELVAFVTCRSEVEPITAELVADEFDVTVEVALLALLALSRLA